MGFGKAIKAEQKRKIESQQAKRETDKDGREVFVVEAKEGNSRSVLEQSSLDDIISTIELRKEEWEEAYGGCEEAADGGAVLLDLSTQKLVEVEDAAAKSREMVFIPRRPKWQEGMSLEELQGLENEAFIDWRRGLKQLETDRGLVMTPYERNIDFWRQLWRCMERSDLLVQVLDARDPDFYFCQDLYKYIGELGGGKRLMLLVNKADYLTKAQRKTWADHFAAKGVDAIFFSALNELQKINKEEENAGAPKSSDAQESPRPSTQADAASSSAPPVAVAEVKREAVSTAGLDAVDIPVPDSDDDLDEGEAKEDAIEQFSEADESEDEGAGPRLVLLENADDGVADVAKLLDAVRARLPTHEDLEARARSGGYAGAADVTKEGKRLGVVGFVGYPNVGKSTVINALVGEKKVGMSRTPGKTKHIQTLQLPEWGFTLCDAPGLVFPSVVATRSHLVINNTVPLDDLQECFDPIRLIVEKIGFAEILRRYKCTSYMKDAAGRSGDHVLDEAHSFLAALSVARHHFLRAGVPDENWAARKVLRDYTQGKLLHCEMPPGSAAQASSSSGAAGEPAQSKEVRGIQQQDLDVDSEFEDLDELLDDGAASSVQKTQMTKKKERHLLKQLSRGVAPSGQVKDSSGAGAGRRRENARAKALA